PICLDIVDGAAVNAQFVHAPGGDFIAETGELRLGRPGIAAEVQEDVSVPKLGADRVQPILRRSEAGRIHVRRAQERAVEGVGPAVVRAADPAVERAFGIGTHARAAMAANVDECALGSYGASSRWGRCR